MQLNQQPNLFPTITADDWRRAFERTRAEAIADGDNMLRQIRAMTNAELARKGLPGLDEEVMP